MPEKKQLTPEEQKTANKTLLVLLIIVIAIVLLCVKFCGSDENTNTEQQAKPITDLAKEHAQTADKQQINYAKDVIYLYDQLQAFKNDNAFHSNGMAWAGISRWLNNVKELPSLYPNTAIMKVTVMPGDLEQLARDYYQNKGAETEYTKYIATLVATLKTAYPVKTEESFNNNTAPVDDQKQKMYDAMLITYQNEILPLFDQLMSFKNNPNFHKFGMTWEGLKTWEQQIDAMEQKYDAKFFLNTGTMINPGDLKIMALLYYYNKGKEDDATNIHRKKFETIKYELLNQKSKSDPTNIALVNKVEKEYVQNIISIYDTMIQFKNEAEFHKQGLKWQNIAPWNKAIGTVSMAYPETIFVKIGISPEDLEKAAQDYCDNKGNETDFTKNLTDKINKIKSSLK